MTFIALSGGQHPDHSTIAAFVSSMKDEILPLFRDVLLVCEEMGLLGGTFFALDGLRLPSNASKQWSGTRSELERKKKRIESRVKELLCEHTEEDKRDEGSPKAAGPSVGPDRKRQIERLQNKADRIEKWLQGNEAKKGQRDHQ